ncbi:MAG: 1-deoxy-D-xylulose-5-phosphate synthase [Candidatus Omnitrophota bacterium]|nr:1-deoxy-D-xylulose-5-phosphate synthase [Candidatus Omnitrophota bacterium]
MLLDSIKHPQDLKKIPTSSLPFVAHEIRQKIIQVVSSNGGHLASSLGAVEIAIALHYCLNTPEDKIVWDVGHQAYAHKILTGRYQNFDTLRQFGGISGFPNALESEFDTFTVGHASTAVSLALGLAAARDLANRKEKVVAVIGDGSLTGGLCFEALNNAGHLKKDVIIILNTNEMSIAPSVGSLAAYLNKIISQPVYNRFREALQNFIKNRIPRVGNRMLKLADKFEEVLKGLIVPGIFFEELGFRYFGPLDGHSLEVLVPTLKNIILLKEPRIVHIVTKKGKGYHPAEEHAEKFHSAINFDLATGVSKESLIEKKEISYTAAFSQSLVELAKDNPKIVAITAAMPEGTGLDKFRDNFPARFFDVGIAEQHAVCFAAGLAKGGLRPVVAVYSTFLQRAYDQIIEEIAIQKLPVVLAVDRAGIVGEDGVTHQGIFDIAYLMQVPGMVVMAPSDLKELSWMLEFAVKHDSACAIRYPKDKLAQDLKHEITKIQLGKTETLREGKDLAILALGSMVKVALEAAEELKRDHVDCKVVNCRFAKPLDEDFLKNIAKEFKKIVTIEEGIVDGGFGMKVSEMLHQLNSACQVKIIGLPDEFITHGKRSLLLVNYGLDSKGITKTIAGFVKR